MTGSKRERALATSFFSSLAALALPFAVGAAAITFNTEAHAQDFSSATFLGAVVDASGAPVANAKVTVKSDARGFERTATTNKDGQFTVPLIPAGSYTAVIAKSGFQTTSSPDLRLIVGGANTFQFVLPAASGSDEIVVVAARPKIAFANATTGVNINFDDVTEKLPVGRSITAVTLLAPTAIQGGASNRNPQFADLPTLGGSSVAENAYYVNGLNITNFDNYLGGSLVPFEFYQSVEVKTGGYQAEFGRATGGIVNAVTKAGTNDFELTVSGAYDIPNLSAQAPRTVNDANEKDSNQRYTTSVEVGGPIIKDKLFFYGLSQFRNNKIEAASVTGNSHVTDVSNDPFYGIKLDFLPWDSQHLEFTYFDTTRTTDRITRAFTPSTSQIGGIQGRTRFDDGGENYVGRYTGSFTDWFTFSAAYGKNQDNETTVPSNTRDPFVQDERSGTPTRISTQTDIQIEPIEREREFVRMDADFYFNLFGKHHVRVGWDKEDLTLLHTSNTISGSRYSYIRAGATDTRDQPEGTEYLQITTFNSGGTFSQNNESYYIQDSWDIKPNLNLSVGVRLDKFNASNADGIEFISFDKEIGPRVSVSWDPNNDGRSKFYGFYGRTYLPVAANTAYRNGAAELFFSSFYRFNGTPDPVTGLPTGGVGAQILNFTGASACPAGGFPTAGARGCEVTGDGVAAIPTSFVDQDLKSTYEDEFIAGYKREINDDWRAGVAFTYRNLGRAAEDSSVDPAVLAYCQRNNIVGCEDTWTGFHQYVIINPGSSAKVVLSDPLPGETALRTINFSSKDLGYPEAKRYYYALTFDFERKFDGKWGLQGSYVWSQNRGNYEGFAKSDNGQDDVGITTDFDTPRLVDGSTGYLPNHREHQFKVFGTYAINDSLLLGANAVVTSPRKFGCIGVSAYDYDPSIGQFDPAQLYGAASWYCGGKLTPRGSVSESDWLSQLDMSLRWTVPDMGKRPGDLQLRLDVFNVFDQQNVLSIEERGELNSGAPRSTYQQPTSYQQPRFVRVGFEWKF